jgi:3-oxoacyl-[acyl-carrier protein] reductase/(S)-1-phenylethanol dehydrogenase
MAQRRSSNIRTGSNSRHIRPGVVGFTRALATELGDDGITVNAISPGLTRSPGTLARTPRPGMVSMQDELAFAATMQAIKRPELPQSVRSLFLLATMPPL